MLWHCATRFWPNLTVYDSSWTVASPDLAIVGNNPDYNQDSLTLYFVPPLSDDLDKLWIDNSTYKNISNKFYSAKASRRQDA